MSAQSPACESLRVETWVCATRGGRHSQGFTIVELLVVVGVIALLMAITVPALRGVQQRNRKMLESSNIRQVHQSWMVYANFNNDAALPGYLDEDVQNAWHTRVEYPVAPDPANPTDLRASAQTAAPWTWRLAQYFDWELEPVWHYRDAPSTNLGPLMSIARSGSLPNIATVDDLLLAIAEEPAFGYNSYHLGGWWEMTELDGTSTEIPLPRYSEVSSVQTGSRVSVVSRTVPSVKRSSELIAFCTAAQYDQTGMQRLDDERRGTHTVTPPILADEDQWTSPGGGSSPVPGTIETLVQDARAPIGRYNGTVVLVAVDGSVQSARPEALSTQVRWIDYTERPNPHTFRFTP